MGGPISGGLVALVEGKVSLNMGKIGNSILFVILLSIKLQFSNNLFFLLFNIFVASHFIMSCDDSLNTIFLKILMLRSSVFLATASLVEVAAGI
jgi:hypothetical protein